MIDPSSNPFQREADTWHDEVDAEAARLLRSGAAASPSAARLLAQTNVQQRRAAAPVPPAFGAGLDKELGLLRKVITDQGGPLSTFIGEVIPPLRGAFAIDACSPGPGCMGKTCATVLTCTGPVTIDAPLLHVKAVKP